MIHHPSVAKAMEGRQEHTEKNIINMDRQDEQDKKFATNTRMSTNKNCSTVMDVSFDYFAGSIIK